MKFKLLLIGLLFTSGALFAQDTIRSLVITEANLNPENLVYLELTNMGDEPIQLNQFELGEINHFNVPWNFPNTVMLPDRILQPGETLLMASARDYNPIGFALDLEGYAEKATKDQVWEKADILVHMRETAAEDSIAEDIVSPDSLRNVFSGIVHGRAGFFIRQHIGDTITVIIDQVCGVFDESDGTNITFGDDALAGYSVAGMEGATKFAHLVRRFNVKMGNEDFANARGIGLDDSEWIPIPRKGGTWRDLQWTAGNHGDYNLDENTLESDVFDIDFANKTITVPWGTRRGDDIMQHMVEKPGIGWVYQLSPNLEDSLSFAAKTGDKLEVYICGNDLDLGIFDIIVSDPTPDVNVVVPMSNQDPDGAWRNANDNGILSWPRVTRHESGIDTIWGVRGGIPYATRIDSLLDRLDKPEKASWEIEFASGTEKPDLSNGDKLKVTAENGNVKEYFISVTGYRPSDNAYLSAITWPDIPEYLKGIFGWMGDTIPNFGKTSLNYKVEIPLEVDGNPAFVSKTEDLNAKVQVNRVKNLNGSLEDRTLTYTVTAEDDTTVLDYTIEMIKEKNPANLQPYQGEPFISEVVFGDMWRNYYGEICNPGNQPLDLSNYMIAMEATDPISMITRTNEGNWNRRYDKYIPGYKWQKEVYWVVEPYIAEQDLNVNAIVAPGDVFCLGYINGDTPAKNARNNFGYVWKLPGELDIQFNNFNGQLTKYENPWGEFVPKNGTPIDKWTNANIFLYKILNDSIKLGLKPATDPNDFELIDVFGMGDDSGWNIAGVNIGQVMTVIRKPEIFKGATGFQQSFGTNTEDSEWRVLNQGDFNGPWAVTLISIGNDIGKHYMFDPSHFKSTVSSLIYKVSPGFSQKETIRGLVTGVTVSGLYSNLVKANENQSLNVKSFDNGSILNMDDVLNLNDTLVVLSADSTNTTKYILEVSEQGLSSNALLTSSRFDVIIESNPKSASEDMGMGRIEGMEYGTSLKTVIQNIMVPAGATMDVVDEKGAYVPYKKLNFDTSYVNVTVNDKIYLYVTAENGVTRIQYQLMPEISQSDAFVTSLVYDVSQKDFLIQYVPRGTNVPIFLSNLQASAGASIKLVDKLGNERVDGIVADDDKIVVASPNGEQSRVYFISKLASLYVPETTYLAYILSNKYSINQLGYMIDGVDGDATISEFYAAISVAPGATAVVVDENGIEKATGDIDGSDLVRVTSADGKIVIFYSFGTLTKINNSILPDIGLYPNPTEGVLNINGISPGNRIRIFNSLGNLIKDINATGSIETINLHNQPSGMYFILVSSNNNILGQFKAIKK